MKVLNINCKEYTFEFSIEASLYNECTEQVTNLMVGIGAAQSEADIKNMISTISNVPKVAMTLFYAGLLEHHGANGDKSVMSMADAKELAKTYLGEHKADGQGNFYAIMNEMIACMGDDGFFELTGLSQMLKDEEEPETVKAPKVPQDHKKKAVAVTKN